MRAIAATAAAAGALIAVYLALGGASYAPAKVADPCAPRDWRAPEGVQEVAQQIVLSGLDGAACELGVSREEMVLAFASRDALARFAREHGISIADLERILRASLIRAVTDAERAGALDPMTAQLVRDFARRTRLTELLDLVDRRLGS
jgi:hypothetical protein